MSSSPVYPKVVVMAALFGGFAYGNEKQQGLYKNAIEIIKAEDKEIEIVRVANLKKQEYEFAKGNE
jgi:hypothetical protein